MKDYVDQQVQFAKERADLNKEWMQLYMDAELQAVREAVNKANAANEKRFEGVNEFREQLKDQAGTFITRGELWGWLIALAGVTIAVMGYAARKKENIKFREGSKEDKIKKTE